MGFTIPNAPDSIEQPPGKYRQAEPDKVDIDILVAGIKGDGVVSGCAVTLSSPADQYIQVASGSVSIGGATASVTSGAVKVLGSSPGQAADGSYARFTLIVVNNAGTKAQVHGTAAATPVYPAIPANSVVLAAVYVAPGAAIIDSISGKSPIVDKRVTPTTGGGLHAASHAEGAADTLVGQDVNVRRLRIEDIDGTPVGDIYLRVIDEVLEVRDATDATYKAVKALDLNFQNMASYTTGSTWKGGASVASQILLQAYNGSAFETVAVIAAGSGAGTPRFQIALGKLTGLLDANSQRIINLLAPSAVTEPARKQELDDHAAAADPHTGYRLESADHTHQSTGAQAGQLDHGLALTGLLDDDHTQYQKESEKGAASGYASLDAGTKVPTAELGGAGADATKFLRGDQSWQVPAGGAGGHTIEESGTPLTARTGLNFVAGLIATDDAPGDETDINLDYATTEIADIATAEGAGTSDKVPRADHVHAGAPTLHAARHNAGGADVMAIDAAAGTGSLRTLGTGATQAAVGNHSHAAAVHTWAGELNALTQGVGKWVCPSFEFQNEGTVTFDKLVIVFQTAGTVAHAFTFFRTPSGGGSASVGAVTVAASTRRGEAIVTNFTLTAGDMIEVRHDTNAQNANESASHVDEGARIWAYLVEAENTS